MPVIVVGADTPEGSEAVEALLGRQGEVRAFVSDPSSAKNLKAKGVKVALGDISDASHVGGAALNTFSAVLISTAAEDERERSFARSTAEVLSAWAEALRDAGTNRMIWVGAGPEVPIELSDVTPESAIVNTEELSGSALGAEVARIDEVANLD